MLTKKKIKKIIIFTLIIAFVVLMINVLQIPKLIECEIQTAKYGHEFLDQTIYEDVEWVNDVTRVKVLEYSKFEAKIYCICGDWESGHIVAFVRRKGEQWRSKYEVIRWSPGSADSIVMPYWWHVICR